MRVVVAVVLAGCASQASLSDGACPLLEGRTFASVSQGECGLGPNGPVPCTWHLQFMSNTSTQSAFTWQHSDFGVQGAVQCAGATVTGMDLDQRYAGHFDDTTETLTWDSLDYRPE